MSDTTVPRLEWRLRVMMAERKIKTATELRRQLEEVGVMISTSQLSRMMDNFPARLSRDVFAGLLAVLDCEPGDLIRRVRGERETKGSTTRVAVESAAGPPDTLRLQKRRPRRVPIDQDEDLTGPKVTALPIPERRKPEKR